MEINFCPNWLVGMLPISEQKRTHVALLLSTLFALSLLPFLKFIPHVCLAQKLLGISCPGCGILHSTLAVLRLDFAGAWRANPAGIAVAAMFALQVAVRFCAIMIPAVDRRASAMPRWCSTAAVSMLLLAWMLRLISGGLHGHGVLPKM